MASEKPVIWGIHAGAFGEAESLFLKKKHLALGWSSMPDLSTLPPNRDAFKEALVEVEPTYKPTAVPGAAGQLFRFTHEMKVGDLVIFREKRSQYIHIGRVTGDYQYRPDLSGDYPHVRSVEWLKTVTVSDVSQGALFEAQSLLTLFKIRNYADTWLSLLNTNVLKPISPLPGKVVSEEDETVLIVAESIERNTRDYIIKQFKLELKGHPFADYIAHLLNAMGYNTRVSPPGADGGIDIIAHRDELGFEPPIIKVQVKSGDGNVGQPEVASLIGSLAASGEHGLVVTLADYTPPAKNFAKNKSNLRLLNGEDVIDLTLQHYEQLDSRYRAIIPLKRVYVPEPVED